MPNLLVPLLGGVLLGAASLLLLALSGRVAGVSGIVGGLVRGAGDRGWRVAFVLGLWTGGLVLLCFLPSAMPVAIPASRAVLVVGGLLVGLGAGLANGCTSGHGVCGLGRRSPRSLVAVLVFMTVAVVTANLVLRGVP